MQKLFRYIIPLLFLFLASVSYADFETSTNELVELVNVKVNEPIYYIAGVIYAEAPDESYYCKSLIATTIYIRSEGNSENFYKVCSMDRQYADPIYGEEDDEDWEECLKLAIDLYNNTFVPKVVVLGNGETIYPDHFFSGTHPWWADGKVWKKVGKMKFLKLGKYRRA